MEINQVVFLSNLTLGREDVTQTDIGAKDEAKDTKDHDDDVLEHSERRETLVPESDDLNDWREDQGEGGTAHCTNEGDHISQIGDGCCKTNWSKQTLTLQYNCVGHN